LLHGNGGSGATWRQRGLVDLLQSHFQLLLVDARGFGLSDKPTDPADYEFTKRAADVVAVLDDAGVDKTHLYGYSMGAMATICVLRYAPDRLRSVIIGGHSPNGAADSTSLARDWDTAWKALKTRPHADHDAWGACFSVSKTFPGGVDVLEQTALPVLFFVGEEDKAAFEAQREFTSRTGQAFFSIPGADHGAAGAAVQIYGPRLIDFIEGVESGAATASTATSNP
jgi:pimeloyl-ACP methyl ester carboxylesterase